MTDYPAIELVIFDCDGVLIDSERLSVRVDAQVLTEMGWPTTEAEVIERFMGRSHAYFVSRLEEHLGKQLDADWEKPFLHLYSEAFEAELAPVDGVVVVLDQLLLPTCVASSGSHEKVRRNLEMVGLYERFEGRIFSADDVAQGKPAPDLFEHAARQMGVSPGACVVVEDSQYGVQAARAVGMRVVGYAGGLTPAEWLSGADTIIIEDMRELLGALNELKQQS